MKDIPILPQLAQFAEKAVPEHEELCYFSHGDFNRRYSERELVGQGACKDVYGTYDCQTSRRVALALLRDGQGDRTSFLREARLSARLQHPNIIPIYEIGTNELGQPWFTMKLLEGRSIIDALDLPLQERIQLLLRVCDALAYAHERGVLHLDIKPDNIQLSNHGEVLLCDWGLARQANEEESDSRFDLLEQTRSGIIKGTPGYISPEQACGDNELKNESTDIFALGAVLYTLLCGQEPFKAENSAQMLAACRRGDLQPPAHFAAKSRAMAAVCLKAMAHQQQQRYQSVLEFSRELRRWLDGYATLAENAGFSTQLQLLFKRHRVASLISVAFSGVVISSVSWFVFQLQQSEQETQKVQIALNEESEQRQQLGAEAAPEFFQSAQDFYEKFAFEQASKALTQALRLQPELATAQALLARLYFGKLEFAKARLAFAAAGQQDSPLAQLAQQFAQKPLSTKTLADLIKALPKQESEQLQALLVHSLCTGEKETPPEQCIRKLLLQLYPQMSPQDFSWDEEQASLKITYSRFRQPALLLPLQPTKLDLSGTSVNNIKALMAMPLIELSLARTKLNSTAGLRGVKLERLDLSDSQVSDLRQLKGLPLKELDLRGCPLNSLKSLKALHELKKLTLSESLRPGSRKEQRELQHIATIIYRK